MKQLNPDMTPIQANAMFHRFDQDENLNISFIEFLAVALDPKEVDNNELLEVKCSFLVYS